MAKQLKRKAKTDKVRDKGPSNYERDRGPNTGSWEKLFSGWRGREKYSRAWNSKTSRWGW